MRRCDYCGRENGDDLPSCADCGLSLSPEGQQERQPQEAPAGQTNKLTKCDRCGIESEAGQMFLDSRKTYTSDSGKLCPGCWSKQRRSANRRSLLSSAVLGIAGALILALDRTSSFGCFLFNLFLFNLSYFLIIVPHELGHALVGRLMGMRVFRIVIGTGKLVWEKRLYGVRFQLNAFPYGGFAWVVPSDLRAFRLRFVPMIAAGPGANLLLALMVWPFIESRDSFLALGASIQPFKMFFLLNVLVAAASLIPQQANTILGKTPNDGLAIWQTLTAQKKRKEMVLTAYSALEGMELMEQKRFEDAQARFDKALLTQPDNTIIRSFVGRNLMRLKNYKEAREIFLKILGQPKLESAIRLLMLNNIAYVDALLGEPGLLPEADEYSREALKHLAWHPSVKGTRGTVLVELGQIEAGITLLKEALQEHTEPENKALNACHLAIAEQKRGEFKAASKHWDLARQLDPNCSLLPRSSVTFYD